jgi:hypothetical protein
VFHFAVRIVARDKRGLAAHGEAYIEGGEVRIDRVPNFSTAAHCSSCRVW